MNAQTVYERVWAVSKLDVVSYRDRRKQAGMAYNCAKVYVGSYVGGGTNEFEELIECKFHVRLVKSHNPRKTMFKLRL
jgi:hypothetical protein